MKQFYLTVTLSLIIAFNLFSQTGTIKIAKTPAKDSVTKSKNNFVLSVQFGYLWQGYNNAEIGIKPTFFFKQQPNNISVTLGCYFFNHNVTYITPFVNLKYSGFIKMGGCVGTLAVNYSSIKVNGITDQRITPEIGFDWNANINISYGYNIPIGKEEIPFISPHRIVIRIFHLGFFRR